uniref:Retrotransposon gag domain-containing protein n=2 Tax=Opuntia streptacantha TaxID=393608 RepID=A0A7C9CVQ1_OPUST
MDARIRTMIEQQLEAQNQRMAEMKTKLDELTKKRNSEVNAKISSNVDRNSFKLLPKPEFPSFDGSNPRNWVKKCSRYFALCNIPDSQRVDVASIHLTGKAETWFAHYSAVRKNMDWCDFILDVCTCFKEELGVTRQPNSGSGTPPSVDAPQLLDESPKSNPDVSSHGWVGEGQGQSPNAIGERLEGLNPSNGLVEKSLSSICDKDLDLCEQEVSKDDCCDEHHPLADAFQVFDEMPSAAEAGVPPRDYYQEPPAHDVAHEGSVILANPSEKELGTVSKQCWPFQELELRGCKGGYVGIKVIEQC